ncbi:MAG: hypothetical protein HOV82_10510, partial [Streptomyces sp.]|nr:hypothetical protein [Streptomyces sp.]
MTVRADVAELLRAGYGDRTIARQVGVSIGSVTRARAELGMPKARGGIKGAGSIEDLFWRRVKPTDDGHLEWTGTITNKGTPVLKWGGRSGRNHTAYRVAFRIANGTEPNGRTNATCGHPNCVAPDHVADAAVRYSRRPDARPPGRPPNASRDDIARLLRAGLSNQRIALMLRTDGKRVARVRSDLGIGPAPVKVVTFAEKWAAATEDAGGGHLRWTGRLRDGVTPSLVYRGRDYSARRAAFEEHHGRAAVGHVLPGCGEDWCVRAEHLEDQPMREAL